MYQENLSVGKRAVIVGAELVSLSALLTLLHAGVTCAAMVTEEASHQIQFPYVAMKWALADMLTRTPILTDAKVTNIFGQKRVEGVEIRRNGISSNIECDSVIFTGNWIPENELARTGGLDMDARTKGPRINAQFESSVAGIFAAGNLLRGVETADRCALEGSRAAKSIVKLFKEIS